MCHWKGQNDFWNFWTIERTQVTSAIKIGTYAESKSLIMIVWHCYAVCLTSFALWPQMNETKLHELEWMSRNELNRLQLKRNSHDIDRYKGNQAYWTCLSHSQLVLETFRLAIIKNTRFGVVQMLGPIPNFKDDYQFSINPRIK